jgi:hypothetical protein
MFDRLPRRFRIYFACSAAAVALAATPPAAAAATSVVSHNWGGYAVKTKSGAKFRKVAGTWVVRKPNCSTRSPGYSAAWVGLGGFGQNPHRLEQTGTDANCTAAGKRRYSAWYELLPAGSKRIAMTVHAGDAMSASVEVQGTSVTLRLRNRTTGALFTKTTSMQSPDVTSAEWIVEAPSDCAGGDCAVLPLADFGTVPFSAASATKRHGTPQPISHSSFSVFQIKLRSDTGGYGATASALSSGGTAFSVSYRRQMARSGARARTMPGSAAH